MKFVLLYMYLKLLTIANVFLLNIAEDEMFYNLAASYTVISTNKIKPQCTKHIVSDKTREFLLFFRENMA